MEFDKDTYCSFCAMPGAKHEGGAEFNGRTISGVFCNKICFERWLQWKGAFLKLNSNPPAIKFPQKGQREGQAVLPV